MDEADTGNLVGVLEVFIDAEQPRTVLGAFVPTVYLTVEGGHATIPVGAATLVEDVLCGGDVLGSAAAVDGVAAGGEHAVLQRVGGQQQVVAGGFLVVVGVEQRVDGVGTHGRPFAQRAGGVAAQGPVGVLQTVLVVALEQVEAGGEGVGGIAVEVVGGHLVLGVVDEPDAL